MTVNDKSLAEITERAYDILFRELGSADAIRFLNQFSSGRGDYTAERDHLFADLTMDQIYSEIRRTAPSEAHHEPSA